MPVRLCVRFLSLFALRNGLLKADRYSLRICQRAYSLYARTVQKEIRKDNNYFYMKFAYFKRIQKFVVVEKTSATKNSV